MKTESVAPRRLESQLIDTNASMFLLGVDVGSDAKVLAIRGPVRLVWAKPKNTLLGIRGLGWNIRHDPTTLELRFFMRRDNTVQYDRDVTVFVGGRLSKSRLRDSRALIEQHLGAGAVDTLDPRATVVFGEDTVGDYLAAKRAEPRIIPPAVLELMRRADTAVVTPGDFV